MILDILNLIITRIHGLSFIVSHHIAESLYPPGYAVRSVVPVKDKKKYNAICSFLGNSPASEF